MSSEMHRGFKAAAGQPSAQKRTPDRVGSAPAPTDSKVLRFPPTPEIVLKSFNTRAFKREEAYRSQRMLQLIAEAMAQREPLSFILYWGKGPRARLGAPELMCLDYIAGMGARIAPVHAPGAKFTVIFTDTHAELNGHGQPSIASYFEDLTKEAGQRGFDTCMLSELLRADADAAAIDAEALTVPPELFTELCSSAAKWFHGSGPVEEGAVRYYRANMVEKVAVDRAFPRSIFVTFSSSKMLPLFPDSLPIFYMYSVRHGICAKPWFLPADFGQQPASAATQAVAGYPAAGGEPATAATTTGDGSHVQD